MVTVHVRVYRYGGIYLGLSNTAASFRRPGAIAALWFLAGLGSGWIYNSTIFTAANNFAADR